MEVPYAAQVAAQLERNIQLGDVTAGANDWHARVRCLRFLRIRVPAAAGASVPCLPRRAPCMRASRSALRAAACAVPLCVC